MKVIIKKTIVLSQADVEKIIVDRFLESTAQEIKVEFSYINNEAQGVIITLTTQEPKTKIKEVEICAGKD